jgi:hypothetical protein
MGFITLAEGRSQRMTLSEQLDKATDHLNQALEILSNIENVKVRFNFSREELYGIEAQIRFALDILEQRPKP